jgi:hypothetical protein
MSLQEAALWALEHFKALDEANAKIHCAPVRYSPLTFRLAEALCEELEKGGEDVEWPMAVSTVIIEVGKYQEDPGRA